MLDVTGSREIQATILAIRGAERSIRLGINKEARGAIVPLWRAEVNARARSNMQRAIIAGGVRATASDRGVRLLAATGGKPLSGGLVPSDQWQGAEFGARPERVTATRKGTTYPLWVNRQYEARKPHGTVAMDAASKVGTKLVALWVVTTVDYLRTIPTAEVSP